MGSLSFVLLDILPLFHPSVFYPPPLFIAGRFPPPTRCLECAPSRFPLHLLSFFRSLSLFLLPAYFFIPFSTECGLSVCMYVIELDVGLALSSFLCAYVCIRNSGVQRSFSFNWNVWYTVQRTILNPRGGVVKKDTGSGGGGTRRENLSFIRCHVQFFWSFESSLLVVPKEHLCVFQKHPLGTKLCLVTRNS